MKNKQTNLTVVILAAGMGTRLKDLTKTKPKALTLVYGKPILDYAINWAKLLNPKKIIVVGGYLFEQLKETAQKIDNNVVLVQNKEYATTQRMLSLIAAKNEIEGDLLVFDGDYIYHSSIARKIKPYLQKGIKIFATGQEAKDVELDMMIKADKQNHLINMAKGLTDYEYYFNSLMFCGEDYLADYFQAADKTIQKIGADKTHVEEALVEYASSGGKVKVIDIGAPKWIEIDNQEELAVAEKMIYQAWN